MWKGKLVPTIISIIPLMAQSMCTCKRNSIYDIAVTVCRPTQKKARHFYRFAYFNVLDMNVNVYEQGWKVSCQIIPAKHQHFNIVIVCTTLHYITLHSIVSKGPKSCQHSWRLLSCYATSTQSRVKFSGQPSWSHFPNSSDRKCWTPPSEITLMRGNSENQSSLGTVTFFNFWVIRFSVSHNWNQHIPLK